MFNIFKNITCLLLIHIFANIEIGLTLFMKFGGIEPFYRIYSEVYIEYLIPAMLILIFGRLFVLPIAYKKLENSQEFDLIAKFIQKLKQSFRLKIVVLILAYFSYWSLGFSYFDDGFYIQLRNGIILGLLGNYLVLFAYWFIEDKIKEIIQKYRH